MLARLAAARGVGLRRDADRVQVDRRGPRSTAPTLRFVYGYEEALGSCVGTLVRDKDGITAALAFAELAAARAGPRAARVLDRLDDLARELGVHATGQRSIRVEGADGLARMRDAVDAPGRVAAGRALAGVGR